jgi:hypothetical protein
MYPPVSKLCMGAAVLFGLISSSPATTLYSINWLSDPRPCAPSLQSPLIGPIISSYYSRCTIGDVPVSICPGQTLNGFNPGDPWDRGQAINVIGYQITLILSSLNAQGVMEVGAEPGPGRGADIFATTAGVGSTTSKDWFPPGVTIPQQAGDKALTHTHFDVYASCGGQGTYAALVTIFYTSP